MEKPRRVRLVTFFCSLLAPGMVFPRQTSAEFPGQTRIPPVEFSMGSEEGRPDEVPVRRVRLEAFAMDATPVTYRQYREFMRAGAPVPPYWYYPTYNQNDQPVTGVTWFDAACYCNWRSIQAGLEPAYVSTGSFNEWGYPIWESRETGGLRLPTEAEFEGAARGGLENARFPWGHEFDFARANFDDDRGEIQGRWWRLAKVQETGANGYGLFGMSGNVWQWTDDWYGPYSWSWRTRQDPRGPSTGSTRVVRGGSWGSPEPADLRVSRRSFSAPGSYNYDIGFRCVLPARAMAAARPTPTDSTPRSALGSLCDSYYAGQERRAAKASGLAIDSDFRERLGRYLGERFPESLYFQKSVDGQERLTPRAMADLIIDSTTAHGIHPLFLTGIMVSESGFGTVSFPRWFNNPMAYHWANWKMRYGLPYYEARPYRNRRFKTLREAFEIFSAGIRRPFYIQAARGDLNRFHLLYVGYEAREWMHALDRVYRDMAGVEFSANNPQAESGRLIYLDWESLR